jgi:hypothetical protein
VPRVRTRFHFLQHFLPRETETLFFPEASCFFRAHLWTAWARLFPCLCLLRFHRLAFPPSCHSSIISAAARLLPVREAVLAERDRQRTTVRWRASLQSTKKELALQDFMSIIRGDRVAFRGGRRRRWEFLSVFPPSAPRLKVGLSCHSEVPEVSDMASPLVDPQHSSENLHHPSQCEPYTSALSSGNTRPKTQVGPGLRESEVWALCIVGRCVTESLLSAAARPILPNEVFGYGD